MDAIDRNILIAVQEDGAAGLADLAKVSGLSVSATAERVKRLEERGVIRGWRADLDPASVGCPLLVFLRVTLRPGRDEAAFRKAVKRLAPVLECHAVSGAAGYLLKARFGTLLDAETFVAEEIRSIPGVDGSEILVGLSTVKETSVLPVAAAEED
jgi:Lrp/AsnC family transcriptional regulator, leucine-responsive regulatory protein